MNKKLKNLIITLLTLACVTHGIAIQAQSLRGSRTSMQRQHQIAVDDGFTFLQASQVITSFVENGQLETVYASRHMELHDVSNPYARPAVKLLLDRLSPQYYAACGEKLTVTSLVRPLNRQPSNAASNSVHPTGMAVDLRLAPWGKCRSWLEKTLLSLEGAGLLDVTRERNPPHYHVAVFTAPYVNYVASITNSSREYLVRPGDSLWKISQSMGTSVAQLRSVNNLSGNLINIGQRLQIPAVSSNAVIALNTSAPASVANVSYKVRKGDSLWRIANEYSTSVDRLKSQNELTNNFLKIDQVLQITPGGTGTAD